jgi:hypothetical protein
MPTNGEESYPLSEDPALAQVSAGMRDAGHGGFVVDARRRVVYVTDKPRRSSEFPAARQARHPGDFVAHPTTKRSAT